MTLSKGKAKMKYQAGFSLCGSLQVCFTNLLDRKPAFLHHLRSKQNYQALFVYHSDLRQNYLIFCPMLLTILQFFFFFLHNNLIR